MPATSAIAASRALAACVLSPPVGMRATETAVRSDLAERMPQRGVYGVGLDTCCMVEVDPERFEVMVSEALDGIPAELGELMSNVAVTVQHDGGPAGLSGLYQGVPLTRRSTFYAGALPDRITIYRRAICAVCNSDSEVVEQVRRVTVDERAIAREATTVHQSLVRKAG